jgi:hypothetical protein
LHLRIPQLHLVFAGFGVLQVSCEGTDLSSRLGNSALGCIILGSGRFSGQTRVFELLVGRRSTLVQGLIPSVVALSSLQLGLGRIGFRLSRLNGHSCCADHRMALVDSSVRRGPRELEFVTSRFETRFGSLPIRLSGSDVRLVDSWRKLDEYLAFFHPLIVLEVNGYDLPRDSGADGMNRALEEGIIG